ncbi:MAG: 30S ribosomal protein S8 [Actinomycetota bacterium]|nr:30S ribosomal protein S8 [Actinomycetota bacterium]
MTMTDPIADMLTRVRNANRAFHETVDIPASRIKEEIAKILKEEGYTKDYEIIQENGFKIIRIKLNYGPNRERAITGIKRISKPGLRVYAKKDEIPRVLGGLGTAIISTSKGVMTDRDAKKAGLGGEVICYVW